MPSAIGNRTTSYLPKVSIIEHIKYPFIDPVPQGIHRPFWSVMITAYNRTTYLEQALLSVLEQDPGSDEMQIEVVDDCSTKEDIEAFVKKIGNQRISFYRQHSNVGIFANWNTCINRARGHWIHILHDDDVVLPGFYEHLREAIENKPTKSTIGAAFCRFAHIDEANNRLLSSIKERETPGILSNWIERIAVAQLIECPSIVVKRDVYEQLGGFCLELSWSSDWEMWKRIAAHYEFWYDPNILAYYRVHSASESSRLMKSNAEEIVDVRKCIQISQTYLPSTTASKLSTKAREYYALYSLRIAKKMFDGANPATAIAHIREAFKCSYSFRVIRYVIRLFGWIAIRSLYQIIRIGSANPRTSL